MRHRVFLLFCALLAGCCVLVAFRPASEEQKKKPTPRYGIDVSHHQGTIVWKKVPKTIQFVYIKATEGASIKDSQYRTNVKGASAQGFKVGAYHYFHMTSSARAQFNNFKSVVKKSDLDLIPMVDVETTDGRSSKALRDSLMVFMQLAKDYYGKWPMVYSMQGFYNDHLGTSFNKYHLYIGRYGRNGHAGSNAPEIKGKGTYTIWQYSEKGKVTGITGNVDLAKFNSHHNINSISLR